MANLVKTEEFITELRNIFKKYGTHLLVVDDYDSDDLFIGEKVTIQSISYDNELEIYIDNIKELSKKLRTWA